MMKIWWNYELINYLGIYTVYINKLTFKQFAF